MRPSGRSRGTSKSPSGSRGRRFGRWGEAVVWNGANSYPQIRMYMGMLNSLLDQDDLADENLRSACEFHERCGMRVFAAASHEAWARVLARRGQTEAARREAARAIEFARETGYVLVERRARELLE